MTQSHDAILADPIAHAVLSRFISMLDKTPASERQSPPGFRLNEKQLPGMFGSCEHEDAKYAWGLIQDMEKLEWLHISPVRLKPGYAVYELAPRLVFAIESEDTVRKLLGRPRVVPYSRQWQSIIDTSKFPGDTDKLKRQPIEVKGRSAAEVADRLLQLPRVLADHPNCYPRDLSAFLFWGLSKLLDTRREAVVAAFNLSNEDFPDKPILVHAHLPKQPEYVLFIENESTYHGAIAGRLSLDVSNAAVIWSAGYKASSSRMRMPSHIAIHITPESVRVEKGKVFTGKEWLEDVFRHAHIPMFFFGDLDAEGMGILANLCSTFEGLRAWEPGYDALLAYKETCGGHSPTQGDKEGQRLPARTGCPYADDKLLPCLRADSIFVDQEVVNI